MASPRKTPARRSGATSQRKAPRATRSSWRLPGWVWGLAGMAAGFFLAQHQHGTAPWQEQATSPPQATVLPKPAASQEREAARETEAAAEPAMPTFEFYTLLPETEVIAPGATLPSTASRPPIPAQAIEEIPTSEAVQSDPIAEVIAANTRPDEQAPSKPTAAAEAHRYMLQAASFREISDAEQLRQRLRNLSLLAQISEVQAGGDTWHRVQVGPYEDTRELNRAQDLMSTQGIEPLLIQLQN
ncbi:SPOR domain-containing protein [Halomonas sediminis]|uniref:SPOR domain-containing protein n=1 Tax=Vreelandella zhuhanensis TaxID=2684210 RepID=A0A7X3KS45_9GAMM|nr:SPOR domain-containing protein [Halomonas zhuhanensis]MWJ28707.1 SPOR domain-containing protein [Halomonas zhuhanensis]